MKNIFNAILAVTLISSTAFAQIPNNSFENWTSHGTYATPDGWGTLNNTTAVTSVFTATAGTPGTAGNSYLKLTSLAVGPLVANGIAVSGILDSVTRTPKSGFAYTGQPQSFTGKWQHMIYGTSQGSISVTLTKWNSMSNQREVIATANKTLTGMAMSWANFSIPFVYTSTSLPDSCVIFLQASGTTPTANDYLWVDELAFSGSVAGINENSTPVQSFLAFPNPSTEIVNFVFTATEQTIAQAEIVSLDGKLISSEKVAIEIGENTLVNAISQLSKGIYFFQLETPKGVSKHKFLVD
jgi:hypothetical protein